MQYAADSGAADPAAALRVIVDGIREEGTPVEMVVEELPPLPAAHRAALIRVGREALRNAAKHAPGANVTLTLGTDEDTVFVRSPTTAPASTRPPRSARSTATSAWRCSPTRPRGSAAGWT